MIFLDRADAGLRLAAAVSRLGLQEPVVLALPRGGVPVAAELAAELHAPLDVFVARKVGAPGQEELGIGAVAEGLERPILSESVWTWSRCPAGVTVLVERAREELDRRVSHYRGDRSLPQLAGHDVVLVDDGLATGVTAGAALMALRQADVRRLVLAVPVCAQETAARLARVADDVVCTQTPADFYAVGQWYDDFSETTDDEVLDLLARFRAPNAR